MTELLPCPFCGNEPTVAGKLIYCRGDNCTVFMEPKDWNTRHTPEITDEDVERAYVGMCDSMDCDLLHRKSGDWQKATRAALTAYVEGR